MKKVVALSILGAMIVFLSVLVAQADNRTDAAPATEPKAQVTCPVMGGKVNPELYADVDGKRVYVCCAGCIGAVTENPQKYLQVIQENGETAAPAPEASEKKDASCPRSKGSGARRSCGAPQAGCADLKPVGCPASSSRCPFSKTQMKTDS